MDTKTLCLGVLTLGDASGYDVRKQLTETFSHFMEISPSGIYPALRAKGRLFSSRLVAIRPSSDAIWCELRKAVKAATARAPFDFNAMIDAALMRQAYWMVLG